MSSMDPWRRDPSTIYSPARRKHKVIPPPVVPKLRVRVIFVPWPKDSDESREWKSKSEQWNMVREDKYKIIYWDEHVHSDPVLRLASAFTDSQIYIRGHGSPGAPSIVTKVDDKDIPLEIEEACARLISMGLKPSFGGAIKFHFCYSGTVFARSIFKEKVEKAQVAVARTEGLLEQLEQTKEDQDAIAQEQRRIAREQNQRVQLKKQKIAGLSLGQKFFGAKIRETKKLTAARQARGVARQAKRAAEQARDEADEQIQAGQPYLRNQQLKVPTKSSLAAKGAKYMREQGFTHCSYYGYLGPVESEFGSLETEPTDPSDYHKFVNIEALNNRPRRLEGKGDRVRASVARVRVR